MQTPIIGSRRGGIAELVEEGRTGYLFEPGASEELAALLKRFAERPEELRSLRKNILPPRTFSKVASEMAELYQNVLNENSKAVLFPSLTRRG